MRILSPGNELRYLTELFICHECGCSFIATAAEYQKTLLGEVLSDDGTRKPLYDYRCRCPWCGHDVVREK